MHNLIISPVLQMMVQITDLQTLTFYFTELYTIGGNAFGRPCQFPFLYEKKWYADCTKVDSQNQRPWCSVETDYSVNQLWGYCPTPDSRFISYSLYIWIVTCMINIKSLRLQLLLVHHWRLNYVINNIYSNNETLACTYWWVVMICRCFLGQTSTDKRLLPSE